MRIKLFGRIIYIPVWTKYIGIASVFILLATVGYLLKNKPALEISTESDALSLSTSSNTPDTDLADTALPLDTASPIYSDTIPSENTLQTNPESTQYLLSVYVVGCVSNPSVVKIPDGSIVADAVEAAGGITDDADIESINMAYPVSDNMMITVPSKNAVPNAAPQDEYIITLPPKAASGVAENSDTEESTIESTNVLVNINTADISDLCTLPGIGESTAKKIIAYREEHGLFEHIEDIMNISGIKESRFNSIKDMITT